jgi:hypothetical protein
MLFNLQNLPFLGHIKSLIHLLRCLAVVTFSERSLFGGIKTIFGPYEEKYIEMNGLPINSYFFSLYGSLTSSNTTLLTWNLFGNVDDLENRIAYFEIQQGVDGVDPLTNKPIVEFKPVEQVLGTQYSLRVTYQGSINYTRSFPFRNYSSYLNNGEVCYRVNAYSDDGCLVTQSHIVCVAPPEPPKPTLPSFPPLPPTVLPVLPIVPVDCVDDETTLITGDFKMVRPSSPAIFFLQIQRAIERGDTKNGYFLNFRFDWNIPSTLPRQGPYFVKLEVSYTGPSGPFFVVTSSKPSGLFFNDIMSGRYTMSVGHTANLLNESNGRSMTFRLVSFFRGPNLLLNLSHRYQVLCLGTVAPLPIQQPCKGATIATAPTIGIVKRELIAGIYDDPCGLYQLIELTLPPEILLNTAVYNLRAPISSIFYDLDGSNAGAGFFGATSDPSFQTSFGLTSLGSSVFFKSSYFDTVFGAYRPRPSRGGAYVIGPASSSFAYRDVNGNYVLRTPGTISLLINVANYSDKPITINGQPGIVTGNGMVLTLDAYFRSGAGTVYRLNGCVATAKGSFVIALQTAQEINNFYNSTVGSKTACTTVTAPLPPVRRVGTRGPRTPTPKIYIIQDAHIVAARKPDNLRRDTSLFIDDNSSANKINYFYLEMQNGNKHLVQYDQHQANDFWDSEIVFDNKNPNACITTGGYSLLNAYYYTASGTGDWSLQSKVNAYDKSLRYTDVLFRIEDKALFRVQKHWKFPVLSMIFEYENIAINYEHVFESGRHVMKPIGLASGEFLSGVSKIGGAVYYLTKAIGSYPRETYPYFCYGEGVDGINSFVGIPRAVFETGFLEEQPATSYLMNFIEYMGYGTGAAVAGGDVFHPGETACLFSDLCFDPLVAKRGAVKISTEVTSTLGKGFKGVMSGAVFEVTDPNNAIFITDFLFIRTGGAILEPEIDSTSYFASETGVLSDESDYIEDELALMCMGCGGAKEIKSTEINSSKVTYSLSHDENGYIFCPYQTGTLMFSGKYDVYSPQLDCFIGEEDSPVYAYSFNYVEHLDYSIDGSYNEFFCITGLNCSSRELYKSLANNLITFTGASVQPEAITVEVMGINTGIDEHLFNARRYAVIDDEHVLENIQYHGIDDDYLVQSDDKYVNPGNYSPVVSGGKTGYLNKDLRRYSNSSFNPYAAVYEGDPGINQMIGKDHIHSFVVMTKNASKGDSIGRDIRVISSAPGSTKNYWESELKDLYNNSFSFNPYGVARLDYISDLDFISYSKFLPTYDCDRYTIPIITDPIINVDYNPVKIHIKNESELPIFIDIGAYITKLNKGVVSAEGGIGAATFGNSGKYLFQGNDVHSNGEIASAPYNEKLIARKAIVEANSVGEKFFLDPLAHFITVKVSRLFPRDIDNPNLIWFDPRSSEPSETYIISRTGVPTDIFNYIQSSDPLSKVQNIYGFHPLTQRQDIEFSYKEVKTLVETKTLNLSPDTLTPHTGEVDGAFLFSSSIGYGSTAIEAENDADLGYRSYQGYSRCTKTTWIPSGIGNFNGLTKALVSSSTVEDYPGSSTYSSTKTWALSGYFNGYRNHNLNPSMSNPPLGVTFGEHSGYHFVIKVSGGDLFFSGIENESYGFPIELNASGTGLVPTFPDHPYGKFSNIVGAYIPRLNGYTYKPYQTFNFKSTGQIYRTSYEKIYNGVSNFSIWNSEIGSNISSQKLIDIFTENRNNFDHDYRGLFRSYAENEFYLNPLENVFSGLFLDLSGISAPATGELMGDATIFVSGGQPYGFWGCIEYPAPFGFNWIEVSNSMTINSYHNFRGKDFYLATATYFTSGGFSEANAFNVMKSGVEDVLKGRFAISGLEEVFNSLDASMHVPLQPPNIIEGEINYYTAKFLYSKDKKVIPLNNATFELYRIDHIPEIRLLTDDVATSTERIIAPKLGGRSECVGQSMINFYNIRFINRNPDFILNGITLTTYKDGVAVGNQSNISLREGADIQEIFGGDIFGTSPCVDKYSFTMNFSSPVGGEDISLIQDIPLVVIGSMTGCPILSLSPSSNLNLNMYPTTDVVTVIPF